MGLQSLLGKRVAVSTICGKGHRYSDRYFANMVSELE